MASLRTRSRSRCIRSRRSNPLFETMEPRCLMSGDGLSAQYFNDPNLTQVAATRVDPRVSFNWGYGSPTAGVNVNHFSARWTGYVKAQYSEKYTFYTNTDDGVRLWVNGQLLIDKWSGSGSRKASAQIQLQAGQSYKIRMEYREDTGKAVAQLMWSSLSTAKQIIPQALLSTTLAIAPAPTTTTNKTTTTTNNTTTTTNNTTTTTNNTTTTNTNTTTTNSTNSTDIQYAAPIVITRGGTYTGNWASDNANTPVIIVKTTEAVIIENSNLRGRGNLIVSGMDHTNITVRNCHGYGLNPNVAGKVAGHFVDIEYFDNVVIEHNYLESTSGIYLNRYAGDFSAGKTVRIVANQGRNIDGRKSDGKGGYLDFNTRTNLATGVSEDGFELVCFIQLNHVQHLPGIEIGFNQVVNEPGKSRVEDNISIFLSSGTAASPILVHDNYVQGAYNIKPWQADYADAAYKYDWSFYGGGIMLGDGNSTTLDNAAGYVRAYNNTVLDTTNYGIGISAGHDIEFFSNRIFSAGVLSDGRKIVAQNIGAYIWDMNGNRNLAVPTFFNDSGHDNLIGWVVGAGTSNWWCPNASAWTNNTNATGPITLDTYGPELTLWKNKLAANSVVSGPTN